MLAAACAVGVGCCFAAPIGGRVPPCPHIPPVLPGPRGEASRTLPRALLAAGGGMGTCPSGPAGMGEAVPLDGVPAGRRRKGGAGAVLPEV